MTANRPLLTPSDPLSDAQGETAAGPDPVVPSRPPNAARSLFHLCGGLFALSAIQVLPDRASTIAMAALFAVGAWTMELSRRGNPRVNDVLMRLFGPVAHPHERHRVNSATWYAT